MHEMRDDTLNFRCNECGDTVAFSTHATNPLLRCSCGTPVEVLKVTKEIVMVFLISFAERYVILYVIC